MQKVVSETVYLGLGSNLGDREGNLAKALEFLSDRLKLDKLSRIYDTEPMGNVSQPRFLNMVCQTHTTLAPTGLLILVKAIENRLGRKPDKPNSPRTIDIDILFFGNQVMATPELTIPHPRLIERAFVLIPLAEIAPDFVHPISHRKVSELLENVGGKEGVKLWGVKG